MTFGGGQRDPLGAFQCDLGVLKVGLGYVQIRQRRRDFLRPRAVLQLFELRFEVCKLSLGLLELRADSRSSSQAHDDLALFDSGPFIRSDPLVPFDRQFAASWMR